MPSQLGQLLRSLGREDQEAVSILTQVPGQEGILNVHWTDVEGADTLVNSLVGCNVWFGVQPLDRPERGRGRATDVTGLVALYADIDWKRDGKPDGMSPTEALEFVNHLTDKLGGAEPVYIVASGNGIQPYWRVERQDVEFGRTLLAWWRHQVLEVAIEMKVNIDSQVYDLPRILRVPGPDNLKNVNDPKPTKLVPHGGGTLTREHLSRLIMLNPVVTSPNSDYSQYDRRGGDLSPRDSVRFFTADQADRYIEEHILPDLRQTPEGAGFNNALNRAAFSLAAFIPTFLEEEQAAAILADECARRWGSANAQDWSTIDSGFRGCEWQAIEAPPELASNPFWEHYESQDVLQLAPGRKVREFHYDPNETLKNNASDIAVVELLGRQFKRAKTHQPHLPSEGCYLAMEFWEKRPILAQLRDLAWATRTCPEAILVSAFALLAGNIMPNVKVHGGIMTAASLNTMGLLIAAPGQGKSGAWSVASRFIDIVGGCEPIIFTPSSGQGIPTVYSTWRKPKGEIPGYFERTRYAAIGYFDETDNFASNKEQQSSNLSSNLRSAAMGKAVGSFTVNADTRTALKEGDYAFSLVACGQPLKMAWLLNEDEMSGGLPQRFLWAPAVAMHHPLERGEAETVHIQLPVHAQGRPGGNAFSNEAVLVPKDEYVVWAPPSIQDYISDSFEDRQMFGGDPMKAHTDLARLKIAAYLMMMAGRIEMTLEDWDLAGEIMQMSYTTSQWTYQQLNESQKVTNEAKNKARGLGDAKALVVGDGYLTQQAADSILGKIQRASDSGISAGSLGLSKNVAPYREAAIDHLEGQGLIRVEVLPNRGRKLHLNVIA